MTNKQKQLRAHLLMMLEAMGKKIKAIPHDNNTLRAMVEEEKLTFIRKLQAAQDAGR